MAQDPLSHPVWTALTSTHQSLARGSGNALRYPAAVAPYAAVESNTVAAFQDLCQWLAPDETIYVQGERPPEVPGLLWQGTIPCLQMTLPANAALPKLSGIPLIEPLDCRHAGEMVDLITVAYPGYFRPDTCQMGRYFGVRGPDGLLSAMGGERLCFQAEGDAPWREISGLCSHPTRAGKGLGTAILCHLLAIHRAEGSRSWLWVAEKNKRAADLYLRFGFEVREQSKLQRLQRLP